MDTKIKVSEPLAGPEVNPFVLLQEFFHYSVGAVLIFIASIVAAVKCGGVSALAVASVRPRNLSPQTCSKESGPQAGS